MNHSRLHSLFLLFFIISSFQCGIYVCLKKKILKIMMHVQFLIILIHHSTQGNASSNTQLNHNSSVLMTTQFLHFHLGLFLHFWIIFRKKTQFYITERQPFVYTYIYFTNKKENKCCFINLFKMVFSLYVQNKKSFMIWTWSS